jgi:hypothetical protein
VNSETEVMVAVNPIDPRNVATIWQQDRYAAGASRGIVVGRSRDGGRTWSSSAVPGLSCPAIPGRTTNPWLSFSGNGHVLASATMTGARSEVYLTRSVDGGATWTAPTALVSDPASQAFHDKQTTTVDPRDNSRVYAVWNRRTRADNHHDIMLARSVDGGVTWEPARPIHSPGGTSGTVGNQIVVLRDGTLVNVFLQHDLPLGTPPGSAVTEHIKVIRSTDFGATWSDPVTIDDIRLNIPVLPESGRPVIAPGLVPDIAVDPLTGAVYVVWADANLATSGSAVGLAASYDSGRTWTAPRRVDRSPESAAGGVGQAFLPQVDVAINGTVAVTYYDFRSDTPAPGTATDQWIVTCWGSCARASARWSERHLAGPFTMDNAVESFGGPFVGTYVGLDSRPGAFLAAFVMTTDDPTNPHDVYVATTPATPF